MKLKQNIILCICAVLLSSTLVTSQNNCTLACLDKITAMLDSEGEVIFWPADFVENAVDCIEELKLQINNENNTSIFDGAINETWTATENDVNKEYTYNITHAPTGNTCWGNVYIVGHDGSLEQENNDGEEATCNSNPIDFSSYTLEENLTFNNLSLEEVSHQLHIQYFEAFENMLVANGSSSKDNDFLVGWSYEDEINDKDDGSIIISRKVYLIDWCFFVPHEETGLLTVNQTITITALKSMSISNINYADENDIIPINKILVRKDEGQGFIPQLNIGENLASSLSMTIENLNLEDGILHVEIQKYDDCVNGVSSLDLVQITQHIIGNRELESNASIIAADYDESGSINVSDLVKMRNSILGITDCNQDSKWRFYKDDVNEANNFNVENAANYNLSYEINEINNNINIIGIKKGDINNSYTTTKNIKSLSNDIAIQDIPVSIGGVYTISIDAIENLEMISSDFIINSNSSFEIIGFSSTKLEISNQNYFTKENRSTLVWYGDMKVSFKKGDPILEMTIKSKINGTLSEILKPEMTSIKIYSNIDSDEVNPTEISYLPILSREDIFTPSIYFDSNYIQVKANDNKIIKLVELYNISGQQVFQKDNINQTNFKLNVNHSGILTYRVISEHGELNSGKIFID